MSDGQRETLAAFVGRAGPALCSAWLILALAGSSCTLDGRLARASGSAAEPLAEIKVSFKLDPRLTRGMYMGDRWVSPPTFTSVHDGRVAVVTVRARGVDAAGKSVKISPEWRPEDPGMVTVTPSLGERVKITVRREGQSQIELRASGVSTKLLVKATYQGDVTQVEMSALTVPRQSR